jgi:hypothetical protein
MIKGKLKCFTERLECMAAGEYIDHDSESNKVTQT